MKNCMKLLPAGLPNALLSMVAALLAELNLVEAFAVDLGRDVVNCVVVVVVVVVNGVVVVVVEVVVVLVVVVEGVVTSSLLSSC